MKLHCPLAVEDAGRCQKNQQHLEGRNGKGLSSARQCGGGKNCHTVGGKGLCRFNAPQAPVRLGKHATHAPHNARKDTRGGGWIRLDNTGGAGGTAGGLWQGRDGQPGGMGPFRREHSVSNNSCAELGATLGKFWEGPPAPMAHSGRQGDVSQADRVLVDTRSQGAIRGQGIDVKPPHTPHTR